MMEAEHLKELELTSAEMRRMVNQAMARIIPFLESLANQPAADTRDGPGLARSLAKDLPRRPSRLEDLLDDLFDRYIPTSFNTAGPGYLAYIPGGGIFHSAVADLISNAVNRYVGVWAASPVLAQLETIVIGWFRDMIGFPPEALGFLSTGGSLANFSGIVTARNEKLGERFSRGTIYASDQVHHSLGKAARLAGVTSEQVREVPTDSQFRMQVDSLRNQIRCDREKGFSPFLITASAGTTNTGAIDDLDALADLAEEESIWLHVDAAYGGFFMLTERGRKKMVGIERADSLTLDPHKGLFLPYGTGCLLVRDGEALRRAHASFGSYMPAFQTDPDFVDFCEISPELSRDFRGLRVWLPLKLHGIGPFQKSLDEKLDLAGWACERLLETDGIEVVAPPQLSVVAFRYREEGMDTETLNRLNVQLLSAINRRQRVYLSSTLLRGELAIRICVLSFRTHLDRLQLCIEDIRDALREVLPP